LWLKRGGVRYNGGRDFGNQLSKLLQRDRVSRRTGHLELRSLPSPRETESQIQMATNPSLPGNEVNVRGTELFAGESQERYREKTARITLDSMVQFTGLLDTHGTVLDINQVALDAGGTTLSDVVGKPFWTTRWWQVSDEVNVHLRDALQRAAQGEFVRWDTEIYGRAGGRETIIISASLSPVRDEQGQVIYLCAEGRDITEEKVYERESARQGREFREAMSKQNERLKLLWEAAGVLLTTEEPDAMLRGVFAEIREPLGLDGYFSFIVTEGGDALRLVSCAGITEEAARSISWLEFGKTVSGTVARERKPIVAACVQESSDPMMHVVQSYGIRAYACNPLLAGGELLGTLSFASRTRDRFEPEEVEFLETISQYVTVAYERLRLIQQLRDQDRRKDEFLATLAHELRNPLAPIRNGLELIRLAGSNPETLEQARTMIERQIQQMVRLVDDLLDVSRISRNKLELRRESVELAAIVRSATETSRPLLEAADHELCVSLPPEPVLLDADPVRLAQALANLLNNAAKYSERGGRISLTAEHREGEVVVRVRDTGIGIPADQLPHVFDLFVQVDGSRNGPQGGLGIGLTLVRRLVEMHGGTVEACSEGSGRGSEFIIRLPATSVPEQNGLRNEDVTPNSAGAPIRRRILVVDDNRDAADSLAEVLELLGHEVATAYDGLEAVERVRSFEPDLTLMDLGMPRLDGYDAARRIREQPEYHSLKLVALSGWGQAEDKRRSREAGFNDHLVKPVDIAVLEKLIAGL